jgi:uncharacterized protein (TIGR02145 family)
MTDCKIQECPLFERLREALRGSCEWCSKPEPAIAKPVAGTFTDPRDGRTYRTARIGSQIWMAENLAFDYAGSKLYGDNPENAAKYGRLYDWETAMNACPKGWHLPSDAEWQTLVDFASGASVAGKSLKAVDTWTHNATHVGTDDFGFSALPGGFGYNGNFGNVGDSGLWWSATENGASSAWYRYVYNYSSDVYRYDSSKESLLSVRCVKDAGGEA